MSDAWEQRTSRKGFPKLLQAFSVFKRVEEAGWVRDYKQEREVCKRGGRFCSAVREDLTQRTALLCEQNKQ